MYHGVMRAHNVVGVGLMGGWLAATACAASKNIDDGATSATTSAGATTGSGGGMAAAVALPQFVHGAARVDTAAFAKIPIVVELKGVNADAVDVRVDDKPTAATSDGARFIASVDVSALAPGDHALSVSAKIAGAEIGAAKATLVAGASSKQHTVYASDGPAYSSQLVHDAGRDVLWYSWIATTGGKHGFYLNRFDGALTRIDAKDTVLQDGSDEPLKGATAFGDKGIGIVYRTAKAADTHWLVKLRAIGYDMTEIVKAQDVTAGEAAFAMNAAGADPGGFSAAWLHIRPPNMGQPQPVEIRFARWDLAKKALTTLTLDQDQPAPNGSSEGPQRLEPLAEIAIACNDAVCLVSYVRDYYSALVQLNVAKLWVAAIDLATGMAKGAPQAVSLKDWDAQLFGQHLVALPDKSFALVYESNDTAAAVTPKTACDSSLERDLLRFVRFDASGVQQGKPQVLFDFEGTREYPRIAPLAQGSGGPAMQAQFALFWEDQRSECASGGHIRMAANAFGSDLALVEPYAEIPGSIALPPMDPTLAVAGPNALVAWSDNRHGMGLADIKAELFFDTDWRR